jgi:CRISPR-associated protein Csx17
MLPACWLRGAAAPTVEFRLAAAVASLGGHHGGRAFPLRASVEPVRIFNGAKRWLDWSDWTGAHTARRATDPTAWLNAIISARMALPAQTGGPGFRQISPVYASLSDIAAFVDGRTNDRLLVELLSALALIEFEAVAAEEIPAARAEEDFHPSALYGLLKLCFPGRPLRGEEIAAIPAIHRLASAGRGTEAAIAAARRLGAAGFRSVGAPARIGAVSPKGAARIAASLLFPIAEEDLAFLARGVFRSVESSWIQPDAALA